MDEWEAARASPEGRVGRSEYRQVRERSIAEGRTQRHGASFRAIKEHCKD